MNYAVITKFQKPRSSLLCGFLYMPRPISLN